MSTRIFLSATALLLLSTTGARSTEPASASVNAASAKPPSYLPEPPRGKQWAKIPELSDEFDGASLDREKWLDFHPYWKGRDSRFEPANVSVGGGCLRLKSTLRKGAAEVNARTVTAACVSSKNRCADCGYYEARIKASDLSMTTAFWFQGKGHEMDIIENIGTPTKEGQEQIERQMRMNSHCTPRGTGEKKSLPKQYRMGARARDKFQTFAMEWNPDVIRYFHDGRQVYERANQGRFAGKTYLFLDTEVFRWHGWPTRESLLDDTKNVMLVDWVRGWRLVDAVEASAGGTRPLPEATSKLRVANAVKKAHEGARAGPFQPTWSSLVKYEIPEWYRNAKFGIFIHWGPYCVPAYLSEWYPRWMYIDRDTPRGNAFQHHRKTYGNQKTFGYKDFIPKFTAEKFDARQWAELFKEAGARYVVPVAEHHDGFAMYDCSFTKWNAAKMGPKRDVVGELAAAVRARGLRFGVSSHRAFHWAYFARRDDFDTVDPANFGLYGRDIDYLYGKGIDNYKKNHWPPHDRTFKDDWLARTCELVDKYQPDLVWFDFGIAPSWVESHENNPFAEHLKEFAAYYYNRAAGLGRSGIINYKFKAFPEKAAVLDLERSKMDRIRRPFWQTDTAVSTTSWGYVSNHKYKPVNRLVDDLVDIVSKNGCLLLNIGPRADGTIPEHEQEMLREIGRWLKVNGEAIYGARPWRTYGEGPTATATGHLSENKNKAFTPEDIRFTTKAGTLYAIALGWPASGVLTIKSLKEAERVGRVRLLGSSSRLKWSAGGGGLKITLPGTKPCDHAFVFKIEK